MKNTKLLIFGIVGGSAAGKTELVKRLLKAHPDILMFSVSATTRSPGANEKHGIDYYFYDTDRFLELIHEKHFLETNLLPTGSWYGTPRSELEKAQAQDKILVVDMEIKGAKQIYDQYPINTAFVFMDVEDKEAIIRLENASTRKREKIPDRIANLQEQRALVETYDWLTFRIDTTGMDRDKIFNLAETKLLSEIRLRESWVVG